jgi:hypothetical protein
MKAAIALAALLAVASLAPGVASAQSSSPTFTAISANILKVGFDQGDLLVRWTETGITVEEVTYNITGSASATYYCITPSGAPVCEDEVAKSVFIGFTLSPINGTIRQTAAVDEPDPDSQCSCGGPNHFVLYQVDYPSIQIADTTDSGVEPESVGPLSLTFCKLGNLKNCPPPS